MCAASDFELAVSAEMVFTDLPIVERVRRIHDLGFAAEIWSWHDKDLDALAATGATFTSMTGYLHGDLIDPQTADDVVRTAAESIEAAATLGVTRLNLHTAELLDGLPVRPRLRATGAMWTTAMRTLEKLGELGSAAGVTFASRTSTRSSTIRGAAGTRQGRPRARRGVGHPHVKMMLDLYHAQIGEGNLIELVRRRGAAIGEVQVADVPGRCQPGTGEIYYPAVAKTLRDNGYQGTVGLEGYAAGDDVDALEAFRAAFS